MHFGYSLYADHKEEHVIVKKENSNRTYYDEVNSDKTSLLSRTILTKQGAFRNVLSVNSFSGDYRDGRQSGIGSIQRSKRMCASISLFVF